MDNSNPYQKDLIVKIQMATPEGQCLVFKVSFLEAINNKVDRAVAGEL